MNVRPEAGLQPKPGFEHSVVNGVRGESSLVSIPLWRPLPLPVPQLHYEQQRDKLPTVLNLTLCRARREESKIVPTADDTD